MKKRPFVVKKMDRRMTGFNIMKYHVEFGTHHEYSIAERLDEFYKVIRWCEEQYGPTRTLNDLMDSLRYKSTAPDVNLTWTWIRDNFRTKIMFAEKEQAAHYALVFGV
jgi:hypothetical protein